MDFNNLLRSFSINEETRELLSDNGFDTSQALSVMQKDDIEAIGVQSLGQRRLLQKLLDHIQQHMEETRHQDEPSSDHIEIEHIENSESESERQNQTDNFEDTEGDWVAWMKKHKRTLIGACVGLLAAPVIAPVVIAAAGLTEAGIAAGSFAAKAMSAAAMANGGSVAAGGAIATLQSIGATGLGVGGTAVTSIIGGAIGAMSGKKSSS